MQLDVGRKYKTDKRMGDITDMKNGYVNFDDYRMRNGRVTYYGNKRVTEDRFKVLFGGTNVSS